MTERLYDALEICLQKMEQGQSVDTVLKLYPDLASELRPILEASLQARSLAVSSIPNAAQLRGRARLLKRAAELRQSKRVSKRVVPFFPRMALTLGLASGLILGSTGLVGASSNSLPGDQLYPVKRTWEGVQLALVFNQQERETLQSQFEQERLNEIDELLAQNRSQTVTFSGLVIQRQDGKWLVSGIPVIVTDKTRLSSSNISNSVPVQVVGITKSDGVLEADEIQSLQPGSMLPPLEPSENNENTANHVQPVSTLLAAQATSVAAVQTPSATPQSFVFTGIVQKKNGQIWTINGQTVSVAQAEVTGQINLGDSVRFGGYYDENGNFVVTSIESDSGNSSSSQSHSNSNGNGKGSGGDNGGDGGGGGDNGGDG